MSKNTSVYILLVVQFSLLISTTIGKPLEQSEDELVSSLRSKRCVQDCGGNKDQCLQAHVITNIFHKFKCLKAESECRSECEGGRKRSVHGADFFGEVDEDLQRFLSAAKDIWGNEFEMLEELCSAEQTFEELMVCMQRVNFMKQITRK